MASIAETLIAGAQQSAEKGIGDVAGSISTGMQIGLKIQRVQQQREQIEAQKRELMLTKVDRFSQAVERGTNIKDPPARNAFFKNYLPKMRDFMGLTEMFPDTAIQLIQSSPALQAEFVRDRILVQEGKMNAADAVTKWSDPERIAESGGTLEDFASASQFREKQEFRKELQASQQQARLATEQRRTAREEKKAFDVYASNLSKQVDTRFRKIKDQKASVRLAYDSLTKVADQIGRGEQPDEIIFNAASRGLAKAFNSGAMSDKDVEDFRRISGIENITEDAVRKWITGGVNIQKVSQLMALTKEVAKSTDVRAQEEGRALAPQFRTEQFPGRSAVLREKSGIDAILTPTLQYKEKKTKPPQSPWEKFKGNEQVIRNVKDAFGKLEAKDRKRAQEQLAQRLGIEVSELVKFLEGGK